jgi:hypothetical protein
MAETTKQQTQPSVESVRERGGQSAVGAAEGAAAQVARRATAGATQALHAQGEAVRRGASLGAGAAEDAAHATAEAARVAGDAAARTARHTTDAAAEAGEHIAADAAGQVSEIGRRVARAVEDGAEDMRRMLLLPRLAGGGMQEAQQAMAALLDGVLRTNLRMARDIARMADPTSVLDMQRRFMREHLEAMMEGSAHILRAARHTADETLRPLEEHLHDMRERPPMRGADDARGAWS